MTKLHKLRNFGAILIITVLGCVLFYKIFSLFYQQDEWNSIGGGLISGGFFNILKSKGILDYLMIQDRLFSQIAGLYFLKSNFLNTFPIALYSIFFHIVNSVLIYFIAGRFIKNSTFRLIGAVFFLISSVGISAVIWFGTSLGTLPATALIFASVLVFMNYLDFGKKRYLYSSFFLLYLSLFFKETGSYLFLFLPIISIFYSKKKISLNNFLNRYWFFILYFIAVSIARVNLFRSVDVPVANFLTGNSVNFWQVIVARVFIYPIESLSLMFINPGIIYTLSHKLALLYYPSYLVTDIVEQSAISDMIGIFLSTVLIGICFYFSKKENNKNIWIPLLLSVASFLPYVITSKSAAYFDSRHYYLGLGFGVVFLIYLMQVLFNNKSKVSKIISVIIIVLYMGSHIYYLNKEINAQSKISRERINLISDIQEKVPKIDSDRNIFYITSDTNYYVEGNKMPFQQGMGYTLMVLYYKSGKIPAEFIKDNFLWDIASQGYREKDSFGFGYFSDENSLKEFLRNSDFKGDIHSFEYDTVGNELKEILPNTPALN